jgi:hypothetical protein
MALKVRIRENASLCWIIIANENQHLAWSGTRWVPITREGVARGNVKASSYATVKEAIGYAESIGFEVEHG